VEVGCTSVAEAALTHFVHATLYGPKLVGFSGPSFGVVVGRNDANKQNVQFHKQYTPTMGRCAYNIQQCVCASNHSRLFWQRSKSSATRAALQNIKSNARESLLRVMKESRLESNVPMRASLSCHSSSKAPALRTSCSVGTCEAPGSPHLSCQQQHGNSVVENVVEYGLDVFDTCLLLASNSSFSHWSFAA
jgi:hypothetical protein